MSLFRRVRVPCQSRLVACQLLTFTAKLIEAMEGAEALGGPKGLRNKVKASTAAKIADQLRVLRAEIDGQLAELDR